MSEPHPDVRLEIAHVLFMDIVGWSKLAINEQSAALRELNQVVRKSDQVQSAEAAGKLIRLPTGDGMALVFFTTPDSPVRCALEIARALKGTGNVPLRMGIHSGPVDEVVDVNDRSNIAGAGITIAQRVMDCGDAGHILLSKRIAGDLAQYSAWRPHLHELGECEVKHGEKVEIVSLYSDEIGNPATPARLQRAQKPSRRPGTAWLRRNWLALSVVTALLCLIGAAGFLLLHKQGKEGARPANLSTEKRIAVLPFKPLLPENSDQVLQMGMADTLIAKLSNSREVIVSSLNAVRKYSALNQDAVTAGRELQVDSVLEGNVQKAGDRIRVTARLIRVTDGAPLWAGTFDQKFTDVFDVQDAISQKVADALALRLSGEEKNRLTKRYTANVDAYQLYLAGRYQWAKLTPPEIRKSISFFQQAIELDPNYALAYFGLAEANRSLAITADVVSKDCLPEAKAAARKALEIDDSLAEAHASLAFSLMWYDWNWTEAEKEARRAIALNPNSSLAHFSYAHVLSDLGRHDEAIVQVETARRLDPVLLLYQALEGMLLHHAGRNEEAEAKLQKALEFDPGFWITHLTLGKVYLQQRKYPEAISEFEKAKQLSHGNSEAIASIGYTSALAGDKAQARAVLEELKGLANQHYIPPCNIALVHVGMGETDNALRWLDRACDERDVRLSLLKVDPRWHALRSDPRFVSILHRIGLQ